MQDPFFQLVQDEPLNLDSFFSSNLELGNRQDQSQKQVTQDAVAQEEATIQPEQAQAYEEVAQSLNEPAESTSSIQDRINQVIEDYNENPVQIIGQSTKRLVTLADKMNKAGFVKQAYAVCVLLRKNK